MGVSLTENKEIIANRVVLDCGEFQAPHSLVSAMRNMPMKLVIEELPCGPYFNRFPDPDTPQGEKYWKWLRRENKRCADWFMRNDGSEFQLSEYDVKH